MISLFRTQITSLFAMLSVSISQTQPPVPQNSPLVQPPKANILKAEARMRTECPIRLGGVYTRGLGENSAELEDSVALGVKISADNQRWVAENCDVIALNPATITPDTFPNLYKMQKLMTPLLLLSASTCSERPESSTGIGNWKPEMTAWTLHDEIGREVPHPVPGSHWMDFRDQKWADFWRDQAFGLARDYSAQGVVAAQLPLDSAYIGYGRAGYATHKARVQVTGDWLHSVRSPQGYQMIPSAFGFNALLGHPTLPTPPGTEEPELSSRGWDEFFGAINGAWCESWISASWKKAPSSEDIWEIELEAADRAARNGQVFIAAAAFRSDAELEYALASYLLVAHRQGRCVFQPIPLTPDGKADAGYSLAALRKLVSAKPRFFNVPLGTSSQERHPVTTESGSIWRRAFQRGVVYVNSSDKSSRVVQLSGGMERLDGSTVNRVELPPHSGVVLLYPASARQN